MTQSGSRALHIVVMHKDIVVIAQGAVVAAPPVEPNAPWRVAALRTHRHGYNNLSQRGSHQAHMTITLRFSVTSKPNAETPADEYLREILEIRR